MADFHKYKFLYGGNTAYAEGYDRIFRKDGTDDKSEVQNKLPKSKRAVRRKPRNKAKSGEQQV